jgi:ribose/xylose/arabinose/galactoside ABC-type transport system permease subunit
MPAWFNNLGFGRIGIIPIPAIVLLIIFFLTWFIMDLTSMGRSIYAVGGNSEAARLSGINVMKTQMFCFALTAVLSTLSGFMVSGQVMQASFTFGKGWETDVISSVVIGGTSMTGGIGKITGTMLGVIFIGVISNGMTLLNVSVYMQYVIRGFLLFGAVLISIFLPRMKQKLTY